MVTTNLDCSMGSASVVDYRSFVRSESASDPTVTVEHYGATQHLQRTSIVPR